MIHRTRIFQVHDIQTAEELAETLTAHTWVLCQGWRYKETLWLNDSFTEDSLQEYAVFGNGAQFESITVSWCEKPRLVEMIEEYAAEVAAKTPQPIRWEDGAVPRLDHGDGYCPLCR